MGENVWREKEIHIKIWDPAGIETRGLLNASGFGSQLDPVD